MTIVRNKPSGMLATDTDMGEVSFANRGIAQGVTDTFTDLIGRDPTQEEIYKYSSLGDINKAVNTIVSDNISTLDQGQYSTESGVPVNEQIAQGFLAKKYGGNGKDGYELPQTSFASRDQDIGQFITKMDPEQTTSLFKSIGMDEGKASSLAGVISSRDWSGVKEQDIPAELSKYGFNENAYKALGNAMFSRESRLGSDGRRDAVTSHSDNNNTDYKKNTIYDPKRGLVFTGGFIPDPIKADWMGNLVLAGITSLAGMAASQAIGNFAAASGASGSGSVIGGAAGKGVAGTIGSAAGGAVSGGLGAAVNGGNVVRGILGGGVTGGLTSGMNLTPTGTPLIDRAITGAAKGAIGAAASGNDVASGAIVGGAMGNLSPAVRSVIPNNIASGIVNNAVSSALKYAITPQQSTPQREIQTTQEQAQTIPTITSNRRVR